MSKFELIIFDCDGVLIDSEFLAGRVQAEVKTEMGFPITIEEQIRRFTGHGFKSTIVQEELKLLPPHYFETMEERQWEIFKSELKPISYIHSTLEAISLPKCVASSSSLKRLQYTLGLVDLAQYFIECIFSVSLVSRGKPFPDIFLYAAKKMGVSPDKCLVIEDSEAGVRAAKSAGMTVFGFTGGSHMSPELINRLKDVGSHLIFSCMSELPKLINSYF